MSELKHKIWVMGVWAILGTCALFISAGPVQAKDFKKFVVYNGKDSADNHFVASGYMPDGRCIAIDTGWADNCKESKSCVQVKYNRDCTATGAGWAGAYWLDPANNWGDVKGGFDLTGAKKLVV